MSNFKYSSKIIYTISYGAGLALILAIAAGQAQGAIAIEQKIQTRPNLR
ncbi:MAG: hypothetical protein DSM107014_09490 [Gomphosphaeria aponina SAG 52.96 = DSM 107014]|uniref:Uncharacterized protein n=1 Tax=Gomphosphaeria aponina SAG 52.96 = DSM 107014 TaxID=1521640 RepID=A0A941GQP4_9CHRO|nr:hypothetical protein [Gomphosphaeria aponina SAG 52.96 = DSM 107014]